MFFKAATGSHPKRSKGLSMDKIAILFVLLAVILCKEDSPPPIDGRAMCISKTGEIYFAINGVCPK